MVQWGVKIPKRKIYYVRSDMDFMVVSKDTLQSIKKPAYICPKVLRIDDTGSAMGINCDGSGSSANDDCITEGSAANADCAYSGQVALNACLHYGVSPTTTCEYGQYLGG